MTTEVAMTNGTRTSIEHLDALAEANVQFHWGAVVEEVEIAASRLRAMDLNPMLAAGLEARANWMRIIETLLGIAADLPTDTLVERLMDGEQSELVKEHIRTLIERLRDRKREREQRAH